MSEHDKSSTSQHREGPDVPRVVAAADVKDQLTDELLGRFAELLLEANFHPVRDVSDDTKRRMSDTLAHLDPLQTIPTAHPIRQTTEWMHARNYLINHYRELADNNDLRLVMNDGNIVGIAGCEGIGHWEGKEVYELAHLAVVPEYQNQSLSSRLTQSMIQHVREKSPEAFMLTYTKHQKLTGSSHYRDAKELTPEQYVSIQHFEDEADRRKALERRQLKEQEGWKIFLLPVSLEA